MALTLFINPERCQPVLDGVWHRVDSIDMGKSTVVTLCGLRQPLVFDTIDRRAEPVTTCARCDAKYRHAKGIPLFSPR